MRRDKIVLKGMVFYGFHGLNDAEQELGQRFVVDMELYVDTKAAGLSDDRDDAVDYTPIYRMVKEIMEGPSIRLLEAVAETVSRQVLEGFDRVDAVAVSVKKPEVAMKGSILEYAGVEIYRERQEEPGRQDAPPPSPST